MQRKFWNFLKFSFSLAVIFCSNAAFSDYAKPWQMTLAKAATPVMEKIHSLYHFMIFILTMVVVIVAALLTYTLLRFNAKANPTPQKFYDNTPLEIAWTLIPVILLITIAVPTFQMIYYANISPEADLTLKVVGRQWYWTYEYPDNGGIKFDSYMIQDQDLKPGQLRLLDVDNRAFLPAGTTIRIQVTGGDVIHSFAVPSFGVKIDAVPGRVNETWIKVDQPGVYYGQCSELCGVGHAFMPIAIEIVPKEEFQNWLTQAKIKYANTINSTQYVRN